MKATKEKNWRKWCKVFKGYAIGWTCICVGLLIYAFIHPRPSNMVIAGIALFQTVKLWVKEQEVISYVVKSLLILIIFVLLLQASMINLLYTKHRKWEYKGDIKEFKSQYSQEFQAFPDELPIGAKDVQWIVCPGYMQGASYKVLSFKASQSYLDDVVERFEAEATKYVYDWEYNEFPFNFPYTYYRYLTEPEYTDIYILYDNGDNNHRHIHGFWVNYFIGEIGFFEE